MTPFTPALAALVLASAAALADWYRTAELSTTGGSKEVSANFQNVRTVQLQLIDGEVDILVLWIRSVGEKEEHRVERRLEQGETIGFALDGRSITGFRVVDKGNGRYRINVQSDDTQYFEHHRHHQHRRPPPADQPNPPRGGDHAAPPHGDRPDSRHPPSAEKPGTEEKPAKEPPPSKKDSPKPAPKTPPKSAPKAPAHRAPAKGR